MPDSLTKEQRSLVMSKVRSSNTKPELILRSALHRLGFRFTVNNNKMPGKPDLVLPKYSAVIFVHGCFWHGHPGCKDARAPNSNQAFWQDKLAKNYNRDKQVQHILSGMGWRICVVWECELMKNTIATLESVVAFLLESELTDNISDKITSQLNRKNLLANAQQKVTARIKGYTHEV